MTFSSVFLGVATALMVKVFPLFTVFVFGTPVSFVVLTFGITLMVTTDFLLPAFTVIFAVPTCFPVTTPLEYPERAVGMFEVACQRHTWLAKHLAH